ncbi:MAG: hypothetical protein ROO71_03740 [Balneola sp.]
MEEQTQQISIMMDIIIFLAGLVIGNWLAIGRDKRKEFNEVADEVYLALIKEKECIGSKGIVINGPNENSLEILKRRVPFYKKESLKKALRKYKNSRSSSNWKHDSANQPFYKEPNVVISSIDNLIKHVKSK